MQKLTEGVDFDSVAEKVTGIIKGNGHKVILFTEDGMETSNPADARRFYVKNPNYMITLDPENAILKINKNSSIPLADMESIMKQIKTLARTYMLNTEVKVFGKEIAPKDFAYQAKRLKDEDNVTEGKFEAHGVKGMQNKPFRKTFKNEAEYSKWLEKNEGDIEVYGTRDLDDEKKGTLSPAITEASISNMHGSKKTSYQTLESVRLVVRHRKPVDENVRGSRARQIKEIFIQRADEVVRFPHNNLAGARAMARHMYEGGAFDDAIGGYIVETTANLLKLSEFVRYSRTNKLINEQSEDVVKIVRENIDAYRTELARFTGAKTYHKIKEQVQARGIDYASVAKDIVHRYANDDIFRTKVNKSPEPVRAMAYYAGYDYLDNEKHQEEWDELVDAIDSAWAAKKLDPSDKRYHNPNLVTVADLNETDDIRDMFTVRKFDETQAAVLPLIKRMVTEKNAWRSRIEEASTLPFTVSSAEDLTEGGVLEFSTPAQKLGYKIRSLAERVLETTELSQFVSSLGSKLVEGQNLSKFEAGIVRNVLGNIAVTEEQAVEHVDALEQISEDFERKMKLLEYGLEWDNLEEAKDEPGFPKEVDLRKMPRNPNRRDSRQPPVYPERPNPDWKPAKEAVEETTDDWDPEAPLSGRDYEDEMGPAEVCPSCKGSGQSTQATGTSVKSVPCKKCGGSGKLREAKEYDNDEEYKNAYAAWKSRNPSDRSAYGGEQPPQLKAKCSKCNDRKCKCPPSKDTGGDDTWASISAALL